jgi:transcription elongation factor Elf1
MKSFREDSSRKFLVTTFHCAECGHPLSVVKCSKNKADPIQTIDSTLDETGAYKAHNEIMISPCRSCITKYTEPARKLIDAMSEIQLTNK